MKSEVRDMCKKLAALALAPLLALTLFAVRAAAFSDVDGGLYYAAPIAWAVENGITTGTSEDTFSPDALCTRGQIITFLWRAAGSPEPQSTESPYRDVTPDMNADFYRAILWAGENGIIQGDDLDADSFSPNAPCERSSTMRFLWRYAGSPDAGTADAFTDVSPEADYARAVAWAIEAGITSGTTDSTFSPGEPCTRGQIATFLYRCLNEAGEKAGPPEGQEAPALSSIPEPEEEARPLQSYIGEGFAHSLGLDGSEFTSEGVYEADVRVDVYSPSEAVFTIDIPFPLYQACSYLVRFDPPDRSKPSYIFLFLRWDEAFADMIPWEGDHNSIRFVDTSGQDGFLSIQQDYSGDDRIGGSLVRRVTFSPGSYFTFDMLDGYTLGCAVTTSR